MALEGIMEYALARVHARHGTRLTETDWRRLDANRDFRSFFDAARTSALGEWLSSFDPGRDSHALERALRTEWRRYIEGVASWHPPEWQRWLAWLAWLPTLSLLAQLAREQPAPRWLLADPVCGPAAPGTPDERSAALQKTPLAPFVRAIRDHVPVAEVWRAHWHSLLPRTDADTGSLLSTLLCTLNTHVGRLADTDGGTPALRKELAGRLSSLFRAGGATVVATVCHLALLALDLERLRGALIQRHVFAAARDAT